MSSRARRNYDYDAISSLPDTVLSHILSFLPTKQVVATSVLSKRWMHQWRSVLDINLINGKHKEYGGYYYEPIELDDEYTLFSFNEFVYSVFLKLDTIKSFHLKVGYGNSSLEYRGFPSVVKWVDHIVKRGVERLRLTLFTSIDMKLPISILSCRTLVVLNLFAFAVKGFSSVRLPSLKILSLEDCSFLNYRALVLLLIGCPILEELYTTHLEFHFDDSFTHEECESLSLSLSKLTNAQMPYTYCHFRLKALHNVANLYIELNQLYRSFDEIPTFHNLTKLKLHSIHSNWNLLVEVLNHCPKLQNLELDEGSTVDTRQYVQKNWVDPKLVPECLSLHLKTCIFQNFLGQQGELLSTIYILKNARVLQTMIICGAEGLKIERDLSLYPRACPTCELILNADKFSPDRIRFDQLL